MLLDEARIENGLRVYAIGDIHGCFDQLEELLRLIDADKETLPIHRTKVVFLGDYVDRGPENRKVLERLISSDRADNEFVFLLGNHDERMIKFIEDPELVWDDMMKWGGVQTLASYGVIAKPGETNASVSHRFADAVPAEHLEFLKSLKLCHAESDYFFCHAGIRPGIELSLQAGHDLIWIRHDFLQHEGSFEKVVVHGHTPKEEPEVKSNRINVDTRCYDTQVLTAVVLEQDTHRFLQTKPI